MSDILVALGNVFTIGNLAGLIFGTGAGILIGAMPGLSVNMGIALLFPLTFAFQGVGGILMLLGIYCGAIYGGSISAILLKTPGTPASVATTLDGYPIIYVWFHIWRNFQCNLLDHLFSDACICGTEIFKTRVLCTCSIRT